MKKSQRPYYWWYRLRGWAMVPLVIGMVFVTWDELDSDALNFSVGGASFCLGWALRIRAQAHLHYRLKVKNHLAMSGPYSFTRNPVYIGNTMILFGMCVMSELVWLCPLVVLYCFVVYSFVVRYEERHLAAKYGAPYLDYVRHVPRWVSLRRSRAAPARSDARAFLYRSIRSELHIALLLTLPVLKELIADALTSVYIVR